jgi:WD40 repeat protein
VKNGYVATGAYDGLIRIWRYTDAYEAKKAGRKIEDIKPVQICMGHKSNVNAIAFDADGGRMYSGDAEGSVRVWSCKTEGDEDASSYECIKSIPNLQVWSV